MNTLTFTSAEFRVSRESRTITGLAVPYGVASLMNYGRKWSFGRGSLEIPEQLSRVKLLKDHEWGQAIGYIASVEESDAGLTVTASVAPGAAGDEVLALAEHGTYDGLSISVDFSDDDVVEDPTLPGVSRVTRARLKEVSVTPSPAFEDARVSKVALSTTHEETAMTDPTPAVDVTTLTAAFADVMKPIADALTARPTTFTDAPPRAEVNEGPLYRFDGVNRGAQGHDFSSDLIAMSKGDSEARRRIETFGVTAFADVPQTTTPVAATRQPVRRDDLFEMPLDWNNIAPIHSAIRKGAVNDSRGMVLPYWDSAAEAGAVANHTEGVEPEASFTVGTKSRNVTPQAVSGEGWLTREIIDAGGNPTVSTLIWQRMVRAYWINVEEKARVFLEGLDYTDDANYLHLDGLADEDLEAALIGLQARLQFQKGGNRLTDFAVEHELFGAITSARDSSGRLLMPILAPQNASGTTASDVSEVRIGSLTARPAWSIDNRPAVELRANSYAFNRFDLVGLSSEPSRIELSPTVAYGLKVGIWGYALHYAPQLTQSAIRVGYKATA